MTSPSIVKIQILEEDWKDMTYAIDLWTKTHGVQSTLGISKELHNAKKLDETIREVSFTPDNYNKFKRIMHSSEIPEVWFDEDLGSYLKDQGLHKSVSEPSMQDVPSRILNYGYPMPRD